MQVFCAAGMHADRVLHRGEAGVGAHAVKLGGAPVTQQKVGTDRMARPVGERPRQKRGLIEAPAQEAQPMQRDRRDQGRVGQKRARGQGHPAAGEADDLVPVAMLERQDQPARIVLVKKRRAPVRPRPRRAKAGVAMLDRTARGPGQRNAAGVADKPRNHRRVAPARPAQAVIAFHEITAKGATRRIDKADRRLNCRMGQSICLHMSRTLTDRPALMRHRRRAGDLADPFLHHAAIEEVEDRLSLVNKSFKSPLVVSGFPDLWTTAFPTARHVEDEDTLAAQEGAHDLVIHALCLHWADDPVGQLIQARRALEPDGLFLGVLFGGQTLHELRSVLAQAEADLRGGLSPRVAPMAEIRDLGGLLQRAGFALPVADSFTLTATYADPLGLMRDLRAMGETNALAARPRGFMRRDVLMRACQLYAETYADAQGRIPATFELITLTGWSPAESQPQPLRPGSASTRLAEALGTRESSLKD